MSSERRWLTIEEAAEYLRVSKRTLYRWLHDGLLPGYRAGPRGPWRFRREDLDGVMRRAEPEEADEDRADSAGKKDGNE